MTATAPHQDRQFSHGIHIVAMILTFGGWSPIWLVRWQMHKIDRTREAVYEIAQRLDTIETRMGN